MTSLGAGDKAQQFRALTALALDLGSDSNTHIGSDHL